MGPASAKRPEPVHQHVLCRIRGSTILAATICAHAGTWKSCSGLGLSRRNQRPGDATSDLHGLPLPNGRHRREFYTKYDYSSLREYLHQAEGVYGTSMAAWMVVPSQESLTGGPTKQDLIFTGNLLIMEAYSNHLNTIRKQFPRA